MFADYPHFLGIAASVQWDESRIEPARRRAGLAARRHAAADRARGRLHAWARQGVAEHLHAFADGPAAACFEAQTARRGAPRPLLRPLRAGDRHGRPARARLARVPRAVRGAAARGGRRARPARPSGSTTWSSRAWSSPPGQLALLDLRRRPPARAPAGHRARPARRALARRLRRPLPGRPRLRRGARSSTRASARRRCGRPSTPGRVMDGLRSRLRAVRRQKALV